MKHAPRMNRRRISLRRSRRGVSLILFVFFVFIGFAVGAILVDLGMARVTQREMQTAAKTGALEGLRQRDVLPAGTDRQNARNLVRAVFDDNYNFAADPYDFGAGPTFNLAGGFGGGLAASQTVSHTGSYKPIPQLNDGTSGPPINEPHGDMLTGNYDFSQRHDEGYNGGNKYERDDFPSGFAGPVHNSFLMRLRRTNDIFGLDNIAGVSSGGPSLPYFFGRGAWLTDTGPGTYNPRTDGISLHATAIADGQVVLGAGPFNTVVNVPPSGILGVPHYGLHRDYWNLLPVNVWSAAQVLATGEIVGVGVTTGVRDGHFTRRTEILGAIGAGTNPIVVSSSAGFPAPPFKVRADGEVMLVTGVAGTSWTVTRGYNGTTAAAHAVNTAFHLFESASIGESMLSGLPITNGFDAPPALEYVPVFATIGGIGERYIGFGQARLRPIPPLPPPGTYPVDVEIMRIDSTMAPENAMAVLADPMDPALTTAEVNAIFAERLTIDEPLLAPALVRSYGL